MDCALVPANSIKRIHAFTHLLQSGLCTSNPTILLCHFLLTAPPTLLLSLLAGKQPHPGQPRAWCNRRGCKCRKEVQHSDGCIVSYINSIQKIKTSCWSCTSNDAHTHARGCAREESAVDGCMYLIHNTWSSLNNSLCSKLCP